MDLGCIGNNKIQSVRYEYEDMTYDMAQLQSTGDSIPLTPASAGQVGSDGMDALGDGWMGGGGGG